MIGKHLYGFEKNNNRLENKNIEQIKFNFLQQNEILINKNKLANDYENSVKINIPAVMENNIGIMTELGVYVKQGNGNIYFNFGNVLISPDTEQSIRTAIEVASDITNISTNNLDFYFHISDINASMLKGPSAGAAIAIATISALQNKSINSNVIITGTLNHDGGIGIAAGIKEKAIISKKTGADIFLVPYGLSKELNFTIQKYCKKYGIFEHCSEEYSPYWINFSNEANITIKEIKTIKEATQYFFN